MSKTLRNVAWTIVAVAAVLAIGFAVLMSYLTSTLTIDDDPPASPASSSGATTNQVKVTASSCGELDSLLEQKLPPVAADAQAAGEKHVLVQVKCQNVSGKLAVDAEAGYQPGWSEAMLDVVAVTNTGGPPGLEGRSGTITLSFDGDKNRIVVETKVATDRAVLLAAVEEVAQQLEDVGVIDPRAIVRKA